MIHTISALVLLLAFSGAGSFAADAEPETQIITFATSDVTEINEKLTDEGFDVIAAKVLDNRIQVASESPAEVVKFVKANYPRVQVVGTERAGSYLEQMSVNDDIQEYFNAEQTRLALLKIESSAPQLAKVFSISELTGAPKTAEGNTLWALQISENPTVIENEAKILFIGQHHARELTTHHAVLDTAHQLLDLVQANPATAEYLKNHAVWFVPVVNPDGLNYVFSTNRMWRKNRSKNADSSRGVDLNRNYEYKWAACGNNSNVGSTDIYVGSAPNSEPEVKQMDALNALVSFDYVISYHSFGNEVLFPYVCGDLGEDKLYYDIRDRLAKATGFGMRKASSSGEDFEHYYNKYGSISFLLEIGEEFQPDFEDYRKTVWPAVSKVLPFLIQESLLPTLTIVARDQESSNAVNASLSFSEFRFSENEQRLTRGEEGKRWRLAPGDYTVEISAPGFKSESKQVTLDEQTGAWLLEVGLLKEQISMLFAQLGNLF